MLPEPQQKLREQRTMHTQQQTQGEIERSGAHMGNHVNTHEHHHNHETIQPVIQRETVQPTVVHHTNAIRETVHDAPIVHEATTLPTMTQEAFTKQKGDLGSVGHADQGHKHQFYEGAPKIGGQKEKTAN